MKWILILNTYYRAYQRNFVICLKPRIPTIKLWHGNFTTVGIGEYIL